MSGKFPQINRSITALLLTCLYYFFTGLFIFTFILITLLNYHTQLFPENEEYTKLKLAVYKYPFNYNHLSNLGVYLYDHGLAQEAFTTFQVAQGLYRNPPFYSRKVLGQQVSPFTLFQLLTQERTTLEEEINYWKELTLKKPKYRDAYLQTAVLAYKLGRINEAKEYFDKALAVDPLSSINKH